MYDLLVFTKNKKVSMESLMKRKRTKEVKIGSVVIGGGRQVAVQAMVKTDINDIKSAIEEARALSLVRAELIRVAVPDSSAAQKIRDLKREINIPIIADIHFNWKLGIKSILAGADKIRINPANIKRDKIKELVRAASDKKIPIRVGINTGSFSSNKKPKVETFVNYAIDNIKYIEDLGFSDIVVSVKTTDVEETVCAYEMISELIDYPLHVGLTEAGPIPYGIIKSSMAIGMLLREGIGDTIRVSLTSSSVDEVKVAYKILQSLGLRRYTPQIISCPTCGRCKIDLLKIVKEVESKLSCIYNSDLKVAVMGCVVNGPGEAKDADIGIAGAKGEGVIFKQGKIIKRVKEKDLVKELLGMIQDII